MKAAIWITFCCIPFMSACTSGPSQMNSEKTRVGFLEHLNAQDICESVHEHEVSLQKDEIESVRKNWAKDIRSFEQKLDQIFKQKDKLIKTFLWSRERNLQTFPSGIILSSKGLENTEKRLSLYKEIISGLDKPSLLRHILQQEVNSYDLKEGVGKYDQLLHDYVNSLILSSAPHDFMFVSWLKESCSAK